jgi:hypothetical protein
MIFIFAGYHRTKSGQREAQREREEKLEKEKKS